MKTTAEIRSEKFYYFVSVNGILEFESESITEVKNYACKALAEHKKDGSVIFIGMYNVDVCNPYEE